MDDIGRGERVPPLEEQLRLKDELTGLMSLGAWTEGIIRELARSRRNGEKLSVLLLDIDNFTLFNAAFGREEGDQLLQQVALAWKDCTRPYDLLSRLGGDQFGLALPGTGAEDGLTVCDRLRAAMPAGHACCIGIAEWDGVESIDDLVDRAEAALETAVQAGGGRVVVV